MFLILKTNFIINIIVNYFTKFTIIKIEKKKNI
jgi:hypothetical protein